MKQFTGHFLIENNFVNMLILVQQNITIDKRQSKNLLLYKKGAIIMDIFKISTRQPLNFGDILILNGEKCTICDIKGTGTSSIVYEASLEGRKIILKELYPEGLDIFRNTDNSLNIPENSQNDFQSYKSVLEKVYNIQLKFHNDNKSRNYTSEPQKLYNYNNTVYVAMHLANGNSYENIKSENVLSILEVGQALTKAIQNYHQKGFLNLDIKPKNIFVFPETNQLIQLFDFDTVCTKADASEGKFSFSNGYAAPEVKNAKKGNGSFSEIDERADIFSIGSVIFEKIMGRLPNIADLRKGKKWKFEGNNYLKNTVPQLQKFITELFRKTLAADKNERYSSAIELIQTLEKLIKLAGIEVFLKNQRISPCTRKNIYISRDSILSDIEKRLIKHRILYLYALGGSGKSETAREYAEKYANKYDFIQSVFYTDSLKKTIANLDFVGLKDEDRFAYTDEDIDRLYKYKYGLLGNTSLYGTNTLIIIDNYNYNVDPASEEYQQNFKITKELKKLNIHILFTTRIRQNDNTECLELENMTQGELRTLFFRINPKDKEKPERIDLVNEIIEVSYNHTMTVKLVAMQSKKYKKTLKEYLDILKSSGLKSGITGRITNEKDDESVTMSTVYDHIKALFDFDDLNDKQKYIMVNACLLPLSGMEVSTFSQYTDLENFDTESSSNCEDESIEDLINSGWIAYADLEEKRFTSDIKITLHPLICDIVRNELKPELTNDKCRKFYISFLNLIQEWGFIRNFRRNSRNEKVRKNIYILFPKLNEIFNYKKIQNVLNYILLTHDIFIQNHMILSDNKLIMYFGIDTQCIIPNSVTVIGNGAFSNCIYLTQVIIPDSVTGIGEGSLEYRILPDVTGMRKGAFECCTSLTHITIPDSVTGIGDCAFQNCTSLTHIAIPDSVTGIGDCTFQNCTSLTHIAIPKHITKIERRAFENCTSLKHINIPNSVTEIGWNAFANCTSLTNIAIPDSVTEIEWNAFENCTSLTNIDIPDSVTEIKGSAFENCTSLTNINIPNSITEIEWNAFANCTSLTNIDIPDSVTEIRGSAFANCTSLTYIDIPDSVAEIGKFAFENCKSLIHITISKSITIIRDNTFKNCKSLTHIDIPESVTEIGKSAFENCISLTKISMSEMTKFDKSAFRNCTSLNHLTIPGKRKELSKNFLPDKNAQQIIVPYSVTRIEDCTFQNYTLAVSIKIPNSVTEIGMFAFENCTSLTHIDIPNNVTIIKMCTFQNCTSLPHITIPNSITAIEECAFQNCTSLSHITISDSVTEIRYSAFASCTSLTHINIPNNVTKIGGCAFKNCTSLSHITIPNSVTRIGRHTFENCTSLSHITISDSVLEIEWNVFENCISLTQITIPDSVTKISECAFKNCTSLTHITIPDKVTVIEDDTFLNCTSLNVITISNSEAHISDSKIGYFVDSNGLYMKNENLIIKGYKGSTAEQYAQEHGFKFVPLD